MSDSKKSKSLTAFVGVIAGAIVGAKIGGPGAFGVSGLEGAAIVGAVGAGGGYVFGKVLDYACGFAYGLFATATVGIGAGASKLTGSKTPLKAALLIQIPAFLVTMVAPLVLLFTVGGKIVHKVKDYVREDNQRRAVQSKPISEILSPSMEIQREDGTKLTLNMPEARDSVASKLASVDLGGKTMGLADAKQLVL